MYDDLKSLWRILKIAMIIGGVLLTFFAVVEFIQAYQALSALHPWVGIAFAGVFIALVGGLLIYFLILIYSRPTILAPPKIKDRSCASKKELKKYCRYLVRYMARLEKNAKFTDEERQLAGARLQIISARIKSAPSKEKYMKLIETAEQEVMDPLIKKLNKMAEDEVRFCTRDIMLAVALSPYKSVDILIVLTRNGAMIMRVIRIFHGRPMLGDLLKIFWDTLKVVATVNFLNMGGKMMESLGTSLPLFGKVAEAATEGVGAGYFTSVAGYSAIDRCTAYTGWELGAARDRMSAKLARFLIDVKKIFTNDVLDKLLSMRLVDLPREKLEDFNQFLTQACETAIKSTAPLVTTPMNALKQAILPSENGNDANQNDSLLTQAVEGISSTPRKIMNLFWRQKK
jgi:uncharacterized membrane protein YcjF (UPF0283 family)